MDTPVTLDTLLRALNSAFVELLEAPSGLDVPVTSVTLVDPDDLASEVDPADVCLHVGVPERAAVEWLNAVATRASTHRPRVVLSKVAAGSPAMQRAAREAGVALVAVHAQTRSDRLLSTIRRLLEHAVGDTDTDLFGLAQTVAELTKGMVSIEDERSHVLAYSASDDHADELRTLSILGREGPADYLRRLREWGVFDRLRGTDDVVEVPAHDDVGIRRRLVVSIRQSGVDGARTLGTIWIQEGTGPLAPDTDEVLRGASAVAARLIARDLDAPSNEALQIQRLLGARGGGVDVPSLAAALSVPLDGTAAVVAITGCPTVADAIRLRASAFRRDSLVTTISDRIYVLIPDTHSVESVSSWTRQLVDGIESRTGVALRAAIAAPVAGLAEVAAARVEVDRVLSSAGTDRVTTLADARTSVLLGEIIDVVSERPGLHDPRISTLLAYDRDNASTMYESLRVYLAAFGDVRSAATQLKIHPNTLRYRIRRAEEIMGTDLSDPKTRLLIEIQLAVAATGMQSRPMTQLDQLDAFVPFPRRGSRVTNDIIDELMNDDSE